jgi:hypothetical protein
MRRSLRDRLTYANVMSTIAVFAALGGTSYALTLPRNSVGAEQLQSNSVGSTEIRRRAVGSIEIRNRSIRLRDISTTTRESLRDAPGRPGVPFFQSVNSAGGGSGVGNARGLTPSGENGTLVHFSRPVTSCVAVATITSLPVGTNPDPPGGGQVTAQTTEDGDVLVRTYDSVGQPKLAPFNLIVAC